MKIRRSPTKFNFEYIPISVGYVEEINSRRPFMSFSHANIYGFCEETHFMKVSFSKLFYEHLLKDTN